MADYKLPSDYCQYYESILRVWRGCKRRALVSNEVEVGQKNVAICQAQINQFLLFRSHIAYQF